MKTMLCMLLLLILTSSAWAASWPYVSLWKNADQQGDVLLQQGQLQAAARRYHDPFRKAYAESLAGQYAKAVQDLSSVRNADASYNQGNALAHMGDLKRAIKAYDTALSLNPHHRDARHNRELVERALKQPPHPPQTPKDTPNNEQQPPSKSPSQKSTSSSSKTGKGTPAQADPSSTHAQQSPEKKSSLSPATAQDSKSRPTSGPNSPEPLSSPPSDLQREQQQWLRSLPDAPGELLQREFMIEHQLRHRSQELP